MKVEKNCIFHIPCFISADGKSGSQIRPQKMIEAFKKNGYHVDIVMGYGKERKKQIQYIKQNIEKGKKYDFLYSESSTMPTLLTEKNPLPCYPFLDFSFFAYCKKKGINIGLFYRDIHWKFEKYKEIVPWYKRMFSIQMYKYDLRKYLKLVDILYLPSIEMKKYISEYRFSKVRVLPPGALLEEEVIEKRKNYFLSNKNNELKIFYVGGVTGIYDLRSVLKAIKDKENVYMTICCRENEWEKNKEFYDSCLTERITIVHESGENLKKLYLKSDICSCFFPLSEYMSFAVPIKLFEYIGNVTPVIVTKGTVAGKFVEKFGNGISVPYDIEKLSNAIEEVLNNRGMLIEMHENACNCLEQNTWKCRALQVEKDLKGELK